MVHVKTIPSGSFMVTGQQRFGIDGHYLTVPGTVAWLQGIGEVATASGLLGEHQRLWDLMSALFLHRLKEHAATLDLAKREAVAEA